MDIIRLDSVDSTNDYAGRLWRRGGVSHPVCITARQQTAGRGRHGRSWLSPRDAGLYMTVIQPADRIEMINTTHYTLAAGAACVEALRHETRADVRIRGVNDLYVDGRKLGGVLVEAIIEDGCICALATGVGINVRRAERTLPPGAAPAVALEEAMSAESFARLDASRLADALAENVIQWHHRLAIHGEDWIKAHWQPFSL